MRAPKETVAVSHINGCKHIKDNADKWVNLTHRILNNKMTVINNRLREQAIEHLALALHCLQDTFSPGHTTRAHSGTITKPGHITDIHIYNEHNKHTHSAHDYTSGSTKSMLGKMSIAASTELMSHCLDSVANGQQKLHNWESYKSNWLKLGNNLAKHK